MKTSLILPVYNVNADMREMTERCLMSMAQDKPDEVIIVDDGSHIPMTINYFTNLVNGRILPIKENQGYTHAVNEGLKLAKGDVLIVANNDLLMPEKWLEGLLLPIKDGYDIATVNVVDDGQPYQKKREVTKGDKFGSLFAITRKVYKKLGGLDEELGKGYFTDLDYQKRAEDAGFKVGKNWETTVVHFPKSTFKTVDPEDLEYMNARDRFKKKHGSVW